MQFTVETKTQPKNGSKSLLFVFCKEPQSWPQLTVSLHGLSQIDAILENLDQFSVAGLSHKRASGALTKLHKKQKKSAKTNSPLTSNFIAEIKLKSVQKMYATLRTPNLHVVASSKRVLNVLGNTFLHLYTKQSSRRH